MYALELLGGIALEGPDGPLSGHVTQSRQLALLALLGTAGETGHSRDKLLAYLWPENREASARHSLADAVYRLRKTLGHEAVLGRSVKLWLNSEVVRSDVVEFEAALVADELETAASLYRGPFLDGFHLRQSCEFEHWRDAEGRRLDLMFEGLMEELAVRAEAADDHAHAAEQWRRLVAHDPFNSRTVVRLMQAQVEAGDPANALLSAQEHARFLRRELGVEPPEELNTLAEDLRSARPPVTGGARLGSSETPQVSFPSKRTREPTVPVVGREEELVRLDELLGRALAGAGLVAFVTGEAGTGKTVLGNEFCRRATEAHPDLLTAFGEGNAHAGVGDPYLLFREVLSLLTGDLEPSWAAGYLTRVQATRLWDRLPVTARTLVGSSPGLIGAFLDAAELSARLRLRGLDEAHGLTSQVEETPSDVPIRRPELFDQYVRLLRALSREAPLLLFLDDLQWADEGSIDLLFQLGRHLSDCRILVLVLLRPSDVELGRNGDRHPLAPVLNELRTRFRGTEIVLGEGGDRRFVDALVDSEPNTLDESFRDALFRETRGHALLCVELMRSLRDTGMVVLDQAHRWAARPDLDWGIVPTRIDALLRERMERLCTDHQRILRVASVAGERFAVEVVADIVGASVPELMAVLSDELERKHRLIRAYGRRRVPGGSLSEFRFRHIMFQRHVYDGLDEVERALLHEQTGRSLERHYASRASDIAVQLAHHFGKADVGEKAIEYLMAAASAARRTGASTTAIGILGDALESLDRIEPSPDRDRTELDLEIARGLSLQEAGAFASPEAEASFSRAVALAGDLGDSQRLLQAQTGLYAVFHNCARLEEARRLAEENRALADEGSDWALQVWSRDAVARNLLVRGELRPSLEAYERLLADLRARPESAQPARVEALTVWTYAPESIALTTGALPLWLIGKPDRALEWSIRGSELARQSPDPATPGLAIFYLGVQRLFRGEVEEVQGTVVELEELVEDRGLVGYSDLIPVLTGWCATRLGRPDEGVRMLTSALERTRAARCTVWSPMYTGLLVEALLAVRDVSRARTWLDRALEAERLTGDLAHHAETLRLKGEYWLALPGPRHVEAEAAFREAIAAARDQEAKSYELRAATSLAHLLRGLGRAKEARETLGGVYEWFSEGFTTTDLREGRALLEALA